MKGYSKNIIKVVRLELRKSLKKYSKKFVLFLFLISALTGLLATFTVKEGISSDSGLYSVASEYQIDDYRFQYYKISDESKFLQSDNIDVYFGGSNSLYILLKNSDRAKSAADELRNYLEDIFRQQLYAIYGNKAFPVVIETVYLKRDLVYQPKSMGNPIEEENDNAGASDIGSKEDPENIGMDISESISSKTIGEKLPINSNEARYKTPEEFNPPSLISKMIYAFFFVIPSYFAIQVFSSSLIEDRVTKRLDILLSSPISGLQLLIGKMIPYLFISAITIIAAALILRESTEALLYILPIIFFFASLQMFLALTSRSYREMTFLIVVSSLFVTAYIFIPSVFGSTIPVSKVSPITLMLATFEGESVGIRDYLFATLQFYTMGAVILYLSSKALNPEILYRNDLSGRLLAIATNSIRKYFHAFVAAIGAIPFIFLAEFFLLIILFVLPESLSVPLFISVVAFVEEVFKGTIVYAAFKNGLNGYISALFCGVGFFIGEKAILLVNVASQFNNLLFANYLFLPLIIHILSLIAFVSVLKLKLPTKYSFALALATSTILHSVYNYTVVTMI